MKIALGLAALLVGTGAYACDAVSGALAMSREGDGSIDAAVAFDGPPISKPFEMELQLCGAAELTYVEVDAIMPAHQHGMNYIPQVVPSGEGNYDVSGMVFHMPGTWQIQVAAHKGEAVERFTFDVVVD